MSPAVEILSPTSTETLRLLNHFESGSLSTRPETMPTTLVSWTARSIGNTAALWGTINRANPLVRAMIETPSVTVTFNAFEHEAIDRSVAPLTCPRNPGPDLKLYQRV